MRTKKAIQQALGSAHNTPEVAPCMRINAWQSCWLLKHVNAGSRTLSVLSCWGYNLWSNLTIQCVCSPPGHRPAGSVLILMLVSRGANSMIAGIGHTRCAGPHAAQQMSNQLCLACHRQIMVRHGPYHGGSRPWVRTVSSVQAPFPVPAAPHVQQEAH